MEEISGIVEAVSTKNLGIKINGRWYNVDRSFQDVLRTINRGDTVKIEVDDFGNVINLEVLEKSKRIEKYGISPSDKIKLITDAIEIVKLSYSVGIPSLSFEEAEQLEKKDPTKEILKKVREVYEELLSWV